jgi:NADPH2:quinone reductase
VDSAGHRRPDASHSLGVTRALQITRFGSPEVLDVGDLPDPVPGDGQQLYEVSSSGVNLADTHHTSS